MTAWQEKRIGDVLKKRVERGISGLPVMSITMQGVKLRSELERRTESNLSEHEHLTARKNDIVYNTMRMWQGVSGLIEQDCLVSPAYIVCKPTEELDAKFCSYLFKFDPMIRKFESHAFGLTADRLRLYYDDFARIRIKLPPYKEQKKIAEILSTWDRAIEVADQLKEKSNAFLQMQLASFFDRLSELSDPVAVRDVCDVISGGTPSRTNPEYFNGTIAWLKSGEVGQGEIYEAEETITEKGLKNSAAKKIPKDTPVIALYGATAGQVGIIRKEMAINQAIAAVIPKSEVVDPEFLYLTLRYHAKKLISKTQGSGQPNLNGGMIKSLPISVCEVKQQKLASRYILSIYRQEKALEQISKALKQQKQGLMQKLLTGKVRVKV